MNTITSYPAPVPTKPWYASKTLWFNVINGAVTVAGLVPSPIGVAIATVGNVVLRIWFTEKKIER